MKPTNTCKHPLQENPSLLIGKSIHHYKIQSLLGQGSFAVVYDALDMVHHSTVAIKCLFEPSEQVAPKEAVFLNTLRGHPNIIQLVDTIHTPDATFLVMEKCHTDLFDAIMDHKGFNETLTRTLFTQLAQAVGHSHEQGIYHRDLKPENVLLKMEDDKNMDPNSCQYHIKLSDYGLATTDALSTEFGCGSVRYMGPECLAPRDPKHRSIPLPYFSAKNDVWSLGIILINMLTGKNPWVEPCSKDKHFNAHMVPSFPDSFQVQFGFSDALCTMLRRMFHKDPMCRPCASELPDMLSKIPYLLKASEPKRPMRSRYLTPTSMVSLSPPSTPAFADKPLTPESYSNSFFDSVVDTTRDGDDYMFDFEIMAPPPTPRHKKHHRPDTNMKQVHARLTDLHDKQDVEITKKRGRRKRLTTQEIFGQFTQPPKSFILTPPPQDDDILEKAFHGLKKSLPFS